jgi:DNA polymerase I-like protein with 3'-5' exonuclease and polymerase domains
VDIETRQHHITCLGIATSASRAICIPFTCEENSEGYWSVDEETQIVFRLYRLLTHPGVGVIGQNWIYDAQHILRWWHFSPRFAFDTMLAQHVLFPGTPKSLDYLASLYCEHYAQWKGDARHLWKNELEEKKDA